MFTLAKTWMTKHMVNPNDPNDIRAQLMASLQERMAPVAQPDVAAEEQAALEARAGSGTARAGLQLANAFMGRQSDGDNQFSTNLDADAKSQLAAAMEKKRMAAEMDKRREELRNGLSTRFVDDNNLRERTKEENSKKDSDYTRGLADKRTDAQKQHEYDMELARLRQKEGKGAQADVKVAIENEKNTQKLSKELLGPQALDNAVRDIEEKLGGPLSSFSFKGEDLYQNGKKRDLPGVNVPGIGNLSFYSGEARELDGAMSAVFNMTLKDRSGAAVTDNELERLKKEFSDGKYNTEPQKIKALQAYQRRVQEVMHNREAGYKPEIVNEYSDRGGRTSKDINSVQRDSVSPPPVPPKGPQAGHEENGFVFQGGDPSDQANWKKK